MSNDGATLATYSGSDGLRIWSMGTSEVLLRAVPDWKSAIWRAELGFTRDDRFAFLQDKYEGILLVRLPGGRDEVIATARTRVTALAGKQDKSAPVQAQRVRLGVVTAAVATSRSAGSSSAPATGAIVREIMPDSPALASGLKVGDVIVEVNDKPIRNPTDVRDAVNAADALGELVIRVIRAGASKRLVTNLDQ
jgi:hypothetical protein